MGVSLLNFFDLKPLNTSKRALNTNHPFFWDTLYLNTGGLSGLQIQSRNYAVIGNILESDNSNVSTFGRKLMVEGFGYKKNVNLVSLLTRLITVSFNWKLKILRVFSFNRSFTELSRKVRELDTSERG